MDFEEQKRGLMFAMTNTLRTSRLVDMINVQEAAATFGQVLNRQTSGAIIDVTPFYDWLVKDKKCPKDAVDETLLFFKSRGARYQTTIKLPAALESVDEAEQARIVSAFVQRGASSGTYSAFKAVDVAPKETSAKKQAAPGTPPAKADAAQQKKRTRAALLGLLIVIAIGGFAFNDWMNRSAPRVQTLSLQAEGGLPCERVSANGGYVVCRVRKAEVAKLSPAELAAAAKRTQAAAAQQGHARALHVYTVEDNLRVGTW